MQHLGGGFGSGFIPIADYGSEFRKGSSRKAVRLLYSGKNHYDLLLWGTISTKEKEEKEWEIQMPFCSDCVMLEPTYFIKGFSLVGWAVNYCKPHYLRFPWIKKRFQIFFFFSFCFTLLVRIHRESLVFGT